MKTLKIIGLIVMFSFASVGLGVFYAALTQPDLPPVEKLPDNCKPRFGGDIFATVEKDGSVTKYRVYECSL